MAAFGTASSCACPGFTTTTTSSGAVMIVNTYRVIVNGTCQRCNQTVWSTTASHPRPARAIAAPARPVPPWARSRRAGRTTPRPGR